jgi:hypothetical protein
MNESVQLQGVTLLAADCAANATNGLARGKCTAVRAPTNQSVIPTILQEALHITQTPLLLFLTQNVTLGHFRAAVNRPLYLIGLVTRTTSIDFHMAVNQFDLTSSNTSTVTFISVVLENLAPGDITSGEIAAPFSILISNNLWQVHVPRWV